MNKQHKSMALSIVQKFFGGVRKVVDGTNRVTIEVTPEHSKKSVALDHAHCALAIACKDSLHADGVIIGTRTGYIIKGRTATRYRLLESTAREIVSFDRHAGFAEGSYELIPPTGMDRLGEGGSGKTHQPSGRKVRMMHHTKNIRARLTMKTAVAAGLILFTAITGQAYTLENPDLKTTWHSGPVPFYINLGSFDNVAHDALADWDKYTGNTHLRGVDVTDGSVWLNHRNDIAWSTDESVFVNWPSNILAVTLPNYNWQTGAMIETDIVFNANFNWSSFDGYYGAPGTYDVGRVMLHEIGHAIGLGHYNGSIMNSYYQYGVWELTADDIAGAKFLYGKRDNSSNVPDTGSTIWLSVAVVLWLVWMRRRAL